VRGQRPLRPSRSWGARSCAGSSLSARCSSGSTESSGHSTFFWPVVLSQHDDSGPQMFLPQQMLSGLAHIPVPQQVAPGAQTMLPQQTDWGVPQSRSLQQIEPPAHFMAPHDVTLLRLAAIGQHPERPLSGGQHWKPSEQHMLEPLTPLGQQVDPGEQTPVSPQHMDPGAAHTFLPQQVDPGEQMELPQQTDPGEPHSPPEVLGQQVAPV